MSTTAVNAADKAASNPFTALNPSSASTSSSTDETADRFLKLLVTQMQNQDPLNPMDNAAVTSQIAQINTVNGIEKLNNTVKSLNGQFAQLQAVSGTALVGRDVTVAGNRVAVDKGVGLAGFELNGSASSVKVEILNPGGRVIGTVELGPLAAGRHGFEWDAKGVSDGSENRFRVVASNGAIAVSSTPLMRDRVQAVSGGDKGLVIETQYSGNVAYNDVKAFN